VKNQALDRSDIQGLVASGYDHLLAARYAFFRVADAGRARAWLNNLLPQVTNAVHPGSHKGATHLNVAFTWNGLVALSERDLIKGFPYEFVAGMTRPEADLILGDRGDSGADHWELGGPRNQEIHLLLLLHADSGQTLTGFAAPICGPQACAQAGLVEVFSQDAIRRRDDPFEPFGFRDGISQPAIEGLTGRRPPPALDLIKAGEFLLGHQDEYGQLSRTPAVENWRDPEGYLLEHPECPDKLRAFGTNGTYLVFRKLSQDVGGFWNFVDQHARASSGDFAHQRELFAARMVGRWRSGAPLVLDPEVPGSRVTNDFTYTGLDRSGVRCPIGSHIRRANPRDALPMPALQSMGQVRRHRIIRRGRKYATPAGGSTPDHPSNSDQGLCFIALNGDLRRQFEFIQQTWLNGPTFNGLDNDKDPIVGDNDGSGKFTIQREVVNTHITGLRRFVTVKGGGYLFLPPVRALRFLANYPFQTPCAHGATPSGDPATARSRNP
jgi:Dyp-type peroxidase family